MKRLLFILLLSLPFFCLYAADESFGDGNHYVHASVGYAYKKTFGTFVGFEWERKYYHAWEAYIDLTTTYITCPIDNTMWCTYAFWNYKNATIGLAYKPALVRWKNSNLRGRVGVDMGMNQREKYTISLDFGIEYAYSFPNRIQICFTQKNDVQFLNRYHFKSGLYVGIKVPVN